MQLHLSTWKEIEEYLLRSRGIIIPIGSTEQHGPNGLIGTDSICPTAIAGKASLEKDILVGPTLTLGPAQFNLKFPGTISLRPSTLISVVEDYVLSLASQGFERFYFLNGHGGNMVATRAAFQEIYTKYGMHATPSEVAMAQYVYPEHIKEVRNVEWKPVSSEYINSHKGDDHFDAVQHRSSHPDGKIGSDPSLAKPEEGQQLLEIATNEMLEDYKKFLDEE